MRQRARTAQVSPSHRCLHKMTHPAVANASTPGIRALATALPPLACEAGTDARTRVGSPVRLWAQSSRDDVEAMAALAASPADVRSVNRDRGLSNAVLRCTDARSMPSKSNRAPTWRVRCGVICTCMGSWPAGPCDPVPDNGWPPSARRGSCFPVHAISSVFWGKFLQALEGACQDGIVTREPAVGPPQQRQRMRALRRHDWVVYAKARIAGPAALLDYLLRYTHRTAVGNERLVGIDGDRVLLRVRASQEQGQRIVAIDGVQVIGRPLKHVLPAGFKRIRRYGCSHPPSRPAALAVARRSWACRRPIPKRDKACSSSCSAQYTIGDRPGGVLRVAQSLDDRFERHQRSGDAQGAIRAGAFQEGAVVFNSTFRDSPSLAAGSRPGWRPRRRRTASRRVRRLLAPRGGAGCYGYRISPQRRRT